MELGKSKKVENPTVEQNQNPDVKGSEAWKAFLISLDKRKEVYRRLADS